MSLQLDKEKLEKIPILKRLRALEEQAGKDVTLGAAAVVAEPSLRTRQGPRPRQSTEQDPEGGSKQKRVQSEQQARQRPARERKESRGDDGAGKGGEVNERGKGRGGGNMKEGGGRPKFADSYAASKFNLSTPAHLTHMELFSNNITGCRFLLFKWNILGTRSILYFVFHLGG